MKFTLAPGEIALAAATAKTVLQVKAPANIRLKLLEWGVAFDGTNGAAEPVVVQLLRTTTDGTFTSYTPLKVDDSLAETIQSTAGHTATAEPTAGDVLEQRNVHPQTSYEKIYSFGDEVKVGGGDRLAIKCTAPAVVNVVPYMKFEE